MSKKYRIKLLGDSNQGLSHTTSHTFTTALKVKLHGSV
jgi:hypothetical protein